jgi:hypothetical protein
MKGTLGHFVLIAGFAAMLAACSGTSSSNAANAASPGADAGASSAAPPAGDDAMNAAYQKLAAAEDDGFAGVLGAKQADDADATYYLSTVVIPNQKCLVTISKKNADKSLVCFVTTPAQPPADGNFAAAKQAAQTALPDLKPSDQSAGAKYINTYFAQDDKHTVAIFEDKHDGGYRVATTFAGPAFYK